MSGDAGREGPAGPAGEELDPRPSATRDRATPERAAAAQGPDAPTTLARLDPRAITLWRVGYVFRGASFVVLALAAELLFDTPLPTGGIAIAVAVLAVATAVLIPPLRHRAWGYLLRESDLYLRHGVLVRTTSLVPHARIQHVDTRHGPIDRWLGLAEVVVFTAGTRGAVLSIPALEAGTAERLRDRLAALSGAGDAV